MIKQYLTIRNHILLVTLLAIFCGLFIPKQWVQDHILWFAVVLILGGVPHGASDYLIFRQLLNGVETRNRKVIFGIFYFSVVLAYALLWWLSPMSAFILFLVIAVYHFGQSNWRYVQFTSKLRETFTYMIWGGLVVGVPVLLYYQESALIIFEITSYQLTLEHYRWPIIFMLLVINIINIAQLSQDGVLKEGDLRREMFNILLLTLLFFTTPLLIGFGVYFVFWHSVGSTLDQITLFKKFNKSYSVKQYLMKLMPFTISAFVGLGLLYWILGDQMNYGINLGVLFLFISIITVPHSILMDRFYLLNSAHNKEH